MQAESEQWCLLAVVAPPYQLRINVNPNDTVEEMKRIIEDQFSRTFGFAQLKVFALLDRNHNDLPCECKIGLVLRNQDKVHVFLDPQSLSLAPNTPKSKSRFDLSQLTSHERALFGTSVEECFKTYFNLREKLLAPNTLVQLKTQLEITKWASAAEEQQRRAQEAEIVWQRVHAVLKSPSHSRLNSSSSNLSINSETKSNAGESMQSDAIIVDSLPAESKLLLPSLGRALVAELNNANQIFTECVTPTHNRSASAVPFRQSGSSDGARPSLLSSAFSFDNILRIPSSPTANSPTSVSSSSSSASPPRCRSTNNLRSTSFGQPFHRSLEPAASSSTSSSSFSTTSPDLCSSSCCSSSSSSPDMHPHMDYYYQTHTRSLPPMPPARPSVAARGPDATRSLSKSAGTSMVTEY